MRDGKSSDPEIVARLRRGDAQAFELAYEKYRSPVFSFLVRMCRDRAAAEDMLQETWLRLARHARRLDQRTHLKGWLFTTARNLTVSRMRSTKTEAGKRAELNHAAHQPPRTPLEHASSTETVEGLERAIGNLAPKYREVILLVGVEAMSPKEVADALGERDATIRKRLSRARAILREELDVVT